MDENANVGESCPVSGIKVNESEVRMIALLVAITASLAAYFQLSWLWFLLAADFSLRAFGKNQYSLLKIISHQLQAFLSLKIKPVDAAPKKFAAALGFIFSLSAGILLFLHFIVTSTLIFIMLLLCALLESGLGICVGCIIYGWLQKLRK